MLSCTRRETLVTGSRILDLRSHRHASSHRHGISCAAEVYQYHAYHWMGPVLTRQSATFCAHTHSFYADIAPLSHALGASAMSSAMSHRELTCPLRHHTLRSLPDPVTVVCQLRSCRALP